MKFKDRRHRYIWYLFERTRPLRRRPHEIMAEIADTPFWRRRRIRELDRMFDDALKARDAAMRRLYSEVDRLLGPAKR